MNFRLAEFTARRFAQSFRNRAFLTFTRSIALASVIIGSMALIIALSVLEGFDRALHENAVRFTAHIQLVTFNKRPIYAADSIYKHLTSAIPEIYSAMANVEREGLVRGNGGAEGVLIKGVDIDEEFHARPKRIIAGSAKIGYESSRTALIGRKLAASLDIKAGDNIILTVMTTLPDGEQMPFVRKFTVSGIYETGMAQYDDLYIYLPIQSASQFFGISDGSVSSFDIMLRSADNIPAVAARIEDILGYPYYAISVNDIHAGIFAWIDLQKKPIPIVLGLISIVAVMNLLTMLLISVVEKTYSVGILRALGMNRIDIMAVFTMQGTLIGVIGTIIGCGLGYLAGLIQQTWGIVRLNGDIYYLDVAPVAFSMRHFIVVGAVSITLSLLATIIPAWIAAKSKPVSSLRFR
ncbi:ABC transporter permease [Ignavibacteria bacterium]|nr:ABC transporter permease [Bacteroidota bacterium]MCZ2133224.1 ABC transporter permease [Bacteroidota bacterium]